MATAPPLAARSKPGRLRSVLALLLMVVLLAAAGFVAAAIVRGEWADVAEKNPVSLDEDVVTQLYQKPNGNVVVRSAVLVDAPPKVVWDVVSGYGKHSDFLPGVSKVEATPQKDGRFLVVGVVHSRLGGDWGFASMVKHTESAEKGEYTASWTERDIDEFKLNRGSWSVTPTDKTQKQSLLVCTLQIEVKDCPNFVVRDTLLYQLPPIVKAMRDEALRRKTIRR